MREDHGVCRKAVFLFILFAISFGGLGWAASDPDQAKANVYFSQGQSAYDPQNRSRSQQEAIQDFLAQAIVQAIGAFMSPSQMGSQYGLLQDKFLKNSGHYVETYQVFSEVPVKGLYQVRGQVTVAMDKLMKDLIDLGLTKEGPRTSAFVSQPDAIQPIPASKEPKSTAGASTAMSRDKQEFYWAVAEKWEDAWHMPSDTHDPYGIFAASALRESQDYGWSLRLPDAKSLTTDDSGNVRQGQAISLAKALGIRTAIIGNVAVKEDENERMVLETSLRIVDVASGQLLGKIQKKSDTGEASNQERAMELASMVMPQIDIIISAPPLTPAPTKSAQEATPAVKFESIKGAGEWTLVMQSGRQFAHWQELEKTLRDHFKSMRIVRLVMEHDKARVQLDGVDGEFLASLQGTKLPSGVQVRIDGHVQETHTLDVSFVRSEAP